MPYRYFWQRLKGFIVHKVLRLDDTPHRIALGVAIGFFVTWTPTIGIQMILVVALATLLKANKRVGVPFVWISNPLTILWIYRPNYFIGSQLLGGRYTPSAFWAAVQNARTAQANLPDPQGWLDHVSHWGQVIWQWMQALWPIFPPLWLGSIIVALLMGFITYIATYYAVVAYRKRHGLQPVGEDPSTTSTGSGQAGSGQAGGLKAGK